MSDYAKKSPVLPTEAREEILDKLFGQMSISLDEVDAIIERYGVSGDVASLQRAYRKRLARNFLSGIRDDDGKREVLSSKNGTFVVVENCDDERDLLAIHNRIQAQMDGLKRSDEKTLNRLAVLGRLPD